MTVLTDDRVLVTHRGSVLSAFLPERRVKPKPAARAAVQPRERIHIGAWLRGRAGAIKDFAVATAAFACGDVAAFHWHPWAGWVAVGLSLVLIDHAVDRGAPPPAGGGQ